jgi:GPH family glycoside/pentoside/hexuronide:cation symporter
MTTDAQSERLPWGRRIAYGLPAFALAVVGIPVYVHIPKFYTDVIGVNIAWVGSILLFVRIFDAFTDPFLGVVSDRTRTRFGRRRPYILVGGFCLALAMLLLFVPPQLSAGQAKIWFTATLFALFLFWTVVTVPYEALGPEMTSDYNERTTLFAVRDGLLIAGTLVAAAAPAVIEALMDAGGSGDRERRKFLWIALMYAPLLIGSTLWCVYRVRERAAAGRHHAGPRGGRNLRAILRNRPFIILLVSYTISAIGSNLPATLILYYVEYVLESTNANLFLFMYFAAGIAMLPVWIKLAGRFGKKNAWLASMAINTCAFSGVFFLGAGDEWLYGVLVVVSGLGFGATLALPSAIQADVIDYDEYLTGRRQEGWYIGVWSVVKKLTAAVGVGAGLTILGAVGYTPGTAQPPEVITALKVLYALVPCLCNMAAFGIALTFPISEETHGKILDGIALVKQGKQVPDPLG